jgi:hypothetical protein
VQAGVPLNSWRLSVPDPQRFDTDPDPRIRTGTSGFGIRIRDPPSFQWLSRLPAYYLPWVHLHHSSKKTSTIIKKPQKCRNHVFFKDNFACVWKDSDTDN